MAESLPPLTWQTSTDNQPEISDSLPNEVSSCLQNARYLHLGTCTDNKPHVSLMNYTYLPSHPFTASSASSLPSGPLIIMTTNTSSRKTLNLLSNPNVSLLVHDWVSARPLPSNSRSSPPPPTRSPLAGQNEISAPGPKETSLSLVPKSSNNSSSLATLLMGLNTSEMGSISATLNGVAQMLEQDSQVEKWCKEQHLMHNDFEESRSLERAKDGNDCDSNAQVGESIQPDQVRVVVVRIRDGRIADWKGKTRDFVVSDHAGGGTDRLVNGNSG